MQTKGRALFNLLRLNWLEDPTLPVEKWQVEDLRSLPIQNLFERLEKLGITLDKRIFLEYVGSSSSPEELVQTLWVDEDDLNGMDQAYLLLFELWRRLIPEKVTLSIFCDELDQLIALHDSGQLQNEELLEDALQDLERLLEENVDQGADAHEIFQEFNDHSAHDLESFICDYALEQVEKGELTYASELVDGFSEFLRNTSWLDLIRVRLLFETDQEEALAMLGRLLESLSEEPDLDLLLEIGRFLTEKGETKLFLQVMRQARDLIEMELDFQELLNVSSNFFRLMDRDEVYKKLKTMLDQRKGYPLEKELRPNDKAVTGFYNLLNDLEQSEV